MVFQNEYPTKDQGIAQESNAHDIHSDPEHTTKNMHSDSAAVEIACSKSQEQLVADGPQSYNDYEANFSKFLNDQLSDDENDLNIANARPKKNRKVLDSDSEIDESAADELKDCSSVDKSLDKSQNQSLSESNDDCEEPFSKSIVTDVRGAEDDIANQDQDRSNCSSSDEHEENRAVKAKKKLTRIAILDSDSEDETPATPHKSFNDDLDEGHANTTTAVYNINKRGELVAENNSGAIEKSRLAALWDSESSEEESHCTSMQEKLTNTSKLPKKAAKISKKATSKSSAEERKMTGKEALQQRHEIRSESQRMLRESRLSLPYHKPKSRSIKEFLQNRPRLSLLKTDNTPPSLAMKMSTAQLEIVTQKLKEREKEVQKFYKSESESEEENVPGEDALASAAEEAASTNETNVSQGLSVINDEVALKVNQEAEVNREIPQVIQEELHSENADIPDDGLARPDTSPLIENANSKPSNADMESQLKVSDVLDQQLALPEHNEQEMDVSEPNVGEIPNTSDENPLENGTTILENQGTNENQAIQSLNGSNNSVEYDFNLDDMEDFSEAAAEPKEKNVEEEHLQRLLKKYEVVDTPDDKKPQDASTKKLNKLELLKQQLGATKPRLSGGPDQEIDLEEGTTKPSAVAQLMERFMQHAAKKNVVRNNIQLDVINLSQGEVRKETVAVSVDPDEDDLLAVTEKPGVKLKKLKTELQTQMAQRRSELWQQKHQPINAGGSKDVCDDEKSDCGADDEDFLDDEEEAELTDGETTEEEDDYDDEDAKEPKKARVQSAFLNDEAEESDADDECDQISQNDDMDEKRDEGTTEGDENELVAEVKKPLRRILKGFTEDSDEEDNNESELDLTLPKCSTAGDRNTSSASTDTWEDDEVVRPYQSRPDKTPHREMTQSKPDLGFLTPVIHLTGLQGLNSGSKFLRESPVSPFSLPPDPSPLKEKNWNSTLQKKLFSDSCETLDSEANIEDIAQLCSGKFTSLTSETTILDSGNSQTVTTQDLISICSGSFSGVTVNASKELEDSSENLAPLMEKNSIEPDIADKGTSNSQMISLTLNSNAEVKNLDEDRLISELLDEEEMEQFKKNFESPIAPTLSANVDDSEQEVQGGGILFDSSEDEDGETGKKKVTKKLHKKLIFSDDESNSDLEEEVEDDEEIRLHDDLSGEDDGAEHKLVDYDSEENEIEIDDEEAMLQKKLKPSDFFENEAELTESEWGSADEDEKDLDTLDFEQGDEEVFDDNKIRTDLEKIHMRQVLDQDNQEIKILQELLLEDGELHGTGRQRQFRWKNIDDVGKDENAQGDAEVETYLDEEESEEQWRRARHQREMFLKTQQEKHVAFESDDIILEDSNSQVIKIGQEVVRKSLSTASTPADKVKKPGTGSSEVKKPLMLMNTRGSFLARDDKFLTRLATFTKVSTGVAVGAPKNSKNFVFQSLADSADGNVDETSLLNKKRKAVDGTPTFIKKLRLSSQISPVVRNTDRKKQLFE